MDPLTDPRLYSSIGRPNGSEVGSLNSRMSEMANGTLVVGDKVLFTVSDSVSAAFVEGSVTRVTKKQARAILQDGKEVGPFERESRNRDGYYAQSLVVPSRQFRYLYEDTLANREELTRRFEGRKEASRRKREEADQRRREFEERIAAELKEVREAMKTPMGMPMFRMQDTLPDGSRMYMVDIAVHPSYGERKGGWQRMIIRCNKSNMSNIFGDCKPVEMSYSYSHGGTSSFASCSSNQFASDEEAVWDAIRREYFSWS
jgi:hypothetical protein